MDHRLKECCINWEVLNSQKQFLIISIYTLKLDVLRRYSLIDLLRLTLKGAPHFVRCLKPNLSMSPTFDESYILRQLR